jgi:hypothetical protein
MKDLLAALPSIVAKVSIWAEMEQAAALQKGVPLDAGDLADARRAGVSHPEKIRQVVVDQLPEIEDPEIHFLAEKMGLYFKAIPGQSFGYGVLLARPFAEDRYARVHLYVHVAQFERMGGIEPFLKAYLHECVDPGFPFGPLEREAVLVAKSVFQDGKPTA